MALVWSDEALRSRMEWGGGLPETLCGSGSTDRNTRAVREWIPGVMERYGLRVICDAGAGDMRWARDALAGFDYRPFDLIPRSGEVVELDITKEVLPECDVILCRHVLIHFDPPRIRKALELFRRSGRYLLASHYDVGFFDPDSQFNRTDMEVYLGAPIERGRDWEGYLALWEMQ